ncbi:MAG: polysaccharide biosynthesis C-terminal domain-containing protein, partial [Rubripirellula sp.]
ANADSLYLCLLLIPMSLTSLVLLGILRAVGDFRMFAIMTISIAAVRLVFVLLFVIAFSWGVSGALLADVLGGFVAVVSLLTLYRRRFSASISWPGWRALQQMLPYGLRYYFGKISNSANAYSGTMILACIATNQEIGFFAAASQLTLQLLFIPDTLTTVLQPRISANPEKANGVQVAQLMRVTGVLGGKFAIGLILLARPIVLVLFSPAFEPAVVLIRLIAIGVLFRCPSKVFVPYFLGTNRPGIASIAVFIGMIANVSLMLLLYPRFGVNAAAIGLTGGYVLGSIVLAVAFQRQSKMTLRSTYAINQSDWNLIESILKRITSNARAVFR